MPDDIGYSQVDEWLHELPDTFVENVETVPDASVDFNFLVETEELGVHVMRNSTEGPLLIAADITLEGEALEAVHEQRRRFVREIETVLTNAPGIHSYTDGSGEPVSREEFTIISLRHWVYPDGATQHEVSNAIIDVLSAASYVQDTTTRVAEDAN